MTTNKLLKYVTLTAGLVLGATAFAATTGDIYEIRPCTETGDARGAYATIDAPLGSGESLYFKVRLIQRTLRDENTTWRLEHSGLQSEIIDDALYPLQIGIYVSGQLRWATLVDSQPYGSSSTKQGFTDLTFAYKTEPGDFALPIVLATENGPASDVDTATSYLFNNTDKWYFTNANGDTCNFWYREGQISGVIAPDGPRMQDYTLAQSGFYVKTIDFDPEWEIAKPDPNAVWRSIHAGSTITASSNPRLVATPAPDRAVTLHVWSDDETVIKVKGGTPTEIVTGYDGHGDPIVKTVSMGAVTLAGGVVSQDFSVEALAEGEGRTANLVLSAWETYRYDKANQQLTEFLTVPVKCIEPLPSSIVVDCDRTTIIADGNKLVSAARLSVYLTQPYDASDLTVTVTPKFEADETKTDWANYVRFSTTSDTLSTLPSGDEPPKVVIPAGSTEKKSIWVYALRGDEFTVGEGKQVKFLPSTDDEAALAEIQELKGAGAYISAAKPVIVTPDETSEYSVTSGDNLEIHVAVSDTYADMTDTATGYEVQIKTGATSSWQTLPERFAASGEGGELVGLETGKPPTVNYGMNKDQVSIIKVTAPISRKTSDEVKFTVHVGAARTTTAETTDGKDDVYIEGDTVKFKVTLSAENDTGAPIFAFLLCNEDADVTMFRGTKPCIVTDETVAQPDTVGLQISQNGTSVSGSFQILDGASVDDGGLGYSFRVGLCTTKSWDPANRISGYPTTEFINILVYNKEPRFFGVTLNGFETVNHEVYGSKLPKGQTQTFQPEFEDVSYDLAHGFSYKWTAQCDGQNVANGTVVCPDGTPINECPFEYDFPQAGHWLVKIQVKDKDMLRWSQTEVWEIELDILDQPQVEVTTENEDNLFHESDAPMKRPYVSVGLGYYKKEAQPIVVKVTVVPPPGSANPGVLRFGAEYKQVPEGYDPPAENEYYLVFSSDVPQKMFIEELDGTEASFNQGFTFRAEVLNDTPSVDPSMSWKDYYLPNNTKILIENDAPQFTVNPDPSSLTNRITYAPGYKIVWNVRKDVNGDLKTAIPDEWPTAGVRLTFSGCDNADNERIIYADKTGSGTFTPNFGSSQGDVDLMLEVEDKDGSYESFVFKFTIKPSKFLTTLSTGPSGGTSTSKLSQRYARASGLGAGHTFETGNDFSGAKDFIMRWNCGTRATATVYAFGYRYGAVDDGTLNGGKDRAIDQNGDGATVATTEFFSYNRWLESQGAVSEEEQKDSFFYCWIRQATDENGQSQDAIMGGTLSPERPGAVASGNVPLPTELTGDGIAYPDTSVEAIFSREWRKGDNLGDINQDGVPDHYALKDDWANGKLIELVHGLGDLDGDLLALDASNPDEDYLPGVYENEDIEALVEGSRNSWAPIGPAFQTRMELRGFGDGLNDPDGKVTASDVDLTKEEKNARANWFAAMKAAGDPAVADYANADELPLAVWSPEPGQYSDKYKHMDPTSPDTDGDNLTDGWEYYIWYQAHVTYWSDPKYFNHQVNLFERFSPVGIVTGDAIDPKEVEELFNPLIPRTKEQIKKVPDTDKDGLSDYEEFLIGTNPCKWDTDGDHMADGWEVMMSLDPLNKGDRSGNPDGDYFAVFTTQGFFARTPNGGQGGFDTLPGDEYQIDLSGQYLGFDGMGVYWDMVSDAEYDEDGHLTAFPKAVILQDFTAPLLCFTAFEDTVDPTQAYCYGVRGDMPDDPIVNPQTYWGYFMAGPGDIGFEIRTVEAHAGDELVMPLFVFVHDQVREIFGFDPRTGWYKTANGYVANRWDPSVNEDLAGLDVTGAAVNTEAYSTYDEYLLVRYRSDYSKLYPLPPTADPPHLDLNDMWTSFRTLGTNPNVPKVDVTTAEDVERIEIDPETGATNVVTETVTKTETVNTAAGSIAEAIAAALHEAGKKEPTLRHGADTDGDGVPDGWELYTFRDPCAAYGAEENVMVPCLGLGLDGDLDDDGLTYAMEYAGTDSCNAYKSCESIYRNHPGLRSGWYNKFLPTNPSFQSGDFSGVDTDEDTIVDSLEGSSWSGVFYNGGNTYAFGPSDPGFTFIYGDPVDDGSACIRGGGLNPLSCDTDLDGLPDPWEMAYAGVVMNAASKTYAGPAGSTKPELVDATWIADGVIRGGPDVRYIAGGMDGTWGGDGFTDPTLNVSEERNSTDKLLGTVRDVDFDHDGLQNWQEYLVQQVRHFRYDDITTPLMGRLLKEGTYVGMNLVTPHTQQFVGYTPMLQTADEFVNTATRMWYGAEVFSLSVVTNKMIVTESEFGNATITNYETSVVTNVGTGAEIVRDRLESVGMFQYPWVSQAWEALGYYSQAHHSWDRSIAWMSGMIIRYFMYPAAGGAYFSTDPRMSDTDFDGMDDYYEMFHGLNPILGTTVPGDTARDIIAAGYGVPDTFNAYYNEWTHPDFNRVLALMMAPPSAFGPLTAPNSLDPVMLPWAMGALEADADGDGLRNHEESLLANVTSPTPTHTDPSPRWFTDSTTPKSFVSQYYGLSMPVLTMPFWPAQIGYGDTLYPEAAYKGSIFGYAYAFEENEGFDTDGDWLADQREIIKTVKNTTDPLLFADPVRRQAAYFDGVNSFMMTRQLQQRSCDADDFFKQFTVECWVRPETRGRAQTILERSSYYDGNSVTKLGGVIRANFRVGLSPDGRVYGLFDNTDSIESGLNQPKSCQRVDGGVLPLDAWTHVALAYDGRKLVLYVNGDPVDSAETSLIPANGVNWIGQEVSNPGRIPSSEYEMVPTAFFIGARPQHFSGADNIGFRYVPLFPTYVQGGIHYESFDNYREFFQGYVDEVRLWDGARSDKEILANYRKAMTFDEVAANREEVYESWMLGCSRNNNYNGGLPPELVQHYSFTALPGAVNAADVAKTPFGFDQAVQGAASAGYTDAASPYANGDAVEPLYDIKGLGLKGVPGSWDPKDGIKITWWDECLIHSTVYDDTRIVPWVHNTVAHLPVMDGSCLDSFMYADGLGAQYNPAAASEVEKYVFPNSASPYQTMIYDLDWYNRMFCHDVLTNRLGAAYAPYVTRYQFEIRDHMLGTSDLLPMGGAYAKTCPKLWDGAVADAWELTGTDDDDSGLPDWWEEYARANYCDDLDPSEELNWDTAVTYNGVATTAWQAYLIDLARGLQPGTGGVYDPDYVSTVDADNDSLPDWWENLFGIARYGALDDADHDGLSNYAEWRITYGPDPFGVQNGWPILNPNLLHTDPDFDATDYFITVTNEPYAGQYLGEIVTDHDFMEDFLEPALGTDRTVYDPYSDKDEDGWTAWSELRFSKFKASQVSKLVSHIVGNEEIPDSPVPVVHATIRYNGEKLETPSAVPVVVQAYTGNNLQKKPNATFVIKPGVSEERYVNLGTWEDRVVHGTMTPGFVKGGLDIIKLQQTFVQPDDLYSWQIGDAAAVGSTNAPSLSEAVIYTGTYAEMRAAQLQAEAEGRKFKLNDQSVEWVDVLNETGDKQALQVAVDPQTLRGHFLFMNERVGDIDMLTGDFTFDMKPIGKWYMAGSLIDLQQGYYRIAYTAQVPTLQTGALEVSLANADTGSLKEGSTTFVAFADLDGNNAFDPATEPIGIVRDVAVGWDRVSDVTLEMFDKPACGYRFAYGDDVTKLRIIRNAINGSASNVVRTIVFNRAAADAATRTVWDGDFTTVGNFGLDWASLRGDILADGTRTLKDVTSVGYIVVVGDDKLNAIPDEAIIDSFTVNYIADAAQSLPNCYAPSPKADGVVAVTRPTFIWSAVDGFTAFRLQIADADGALVYSSDVTALPARDSAKRYVWKAPVYVGENDSGDPWTLANNTNYSWRVAMYNPKFSNTNDAASAWSDWTPFRTALAGMNDFTTAYGTAKVEVRYYGPATNTLDEVVVALYRTADFTGVPAAQARLADTAGDVSSLADGQTVTFLGLESGEYYATAYIDRNGNASRDRYETWGYYNQIGHSVDDVYTPLAVTVDASGSDVPQVRLYMEDTDLNQNGVLDPFDDEELLKEADRATTTGGGSSDDTTDADGDGLNAAEESNSGTDASKFDTDDDGMPDGWEALFAGTVAVNPDSDRALDGDVMAYAETVRTVVTDASGRTYVLQTNVTAFVGDEVDPENLISTYDYPVLAGEATNRTVATYLGLGTNLVAGSGRILVDTKREATVVLVHAQVYDEFGFDNKTASPVAGAPHTKPFTALDKYLVARYLEAIGFTGLDEAKMNRTRGWRDCTLKPLDADNDRDGVADGWELYVMFGTNTTAFAAGKALAEAPISPWNFADRALTLDADGLTTVEEYAEGKDPSNPWNEHSVWEALVRDGIIGPEIAPFTDEVRRFGIGESELDLDWDGDLVTNAGEMWAYYNDYASGSTLLADIDPRNPTSDGETPDYFRAFMPAAGRLDYLGGAYNGGEFIEPKVRKLVVAPGIDRAGTRPFQNTGWDIWSTARFSIENAAKTLNIEGVVSDELMLLIRYWNVIRPGEFTGTTVGEAIEFFHTVWEHVIRLIDDEGNVLIEAYDGNVAGPGTIHDADAAQTTTQVLAFFGGQKKVEEVISLNKKDLTADEIVTPESRLNLVLKYAGNESHDLVLESYQVNPAYPEYGVQMTARWTIPVKFDAGIAVINEIRTPALGSLKQGPARFVAYIDEDGDNRLSAADTVGTAGTTVGYKGCDVTIRLGESNPAFPIIDLGGAGEDEAETADNAAADAAGTAEEEPVIQTVAIVRSKVNGQYLASPRGVSLLKYDNNVNRTIVFPNEFVRDDFIGLDGYLAEDYSGDELDEVEEVTYEIVKIRRSLVEDGPEISVTNLNHYLVAIVDEEGNPVVDEKTGKQQKQVVDQDVNETFTVRYSITRDVPLDVAGAAASRADDTVVAFSIPTDRAVTKFWLELDGGVCESPDGRGFLLSSVSADGRVILDQRWFVENNLAEYLSAGIHEIRVGLGNDKFPDEPSDDEWSETATFGIAEEAAFDGAVTVLVAHPFVTAEEFAGRITVAAYDKADLAAQAKVLTACNAGEPIRIEGLRKGADYYIAAWFVKDEEDGRVSAADRLPYDTWGYVTSIGTTGEAFDALPIRAVAGVTPTNVVYLQDTDWNDNGIADREEDIVSVAGIVPSSAPESEEFDLRAITSQGEEEEDPDGDDVPEEEDEDPVFDNGDQWIERDVMAYYQTRGYLVYIACTNAVPGSKKKVTGAWYWLSDYAAEQERLSPNECPVRNGENAANLGSLKSTYVYSSKKNNTLYGIGTNVTFAADAGYAVVNDGEAVGYGWNNIVFVHAQVYSLFGFNAATANGYIPRADWVNTKAFTQADKTTYVQNYLLAIGAITNKKEVATLSVKKLDNDADGVLDGWELYVMFGDDAAGAPAYSRVAEAPHSPWNIADRATDVDADGLTQYQEYDGGYHPTDPFNGDTDGDGISDALAFKYHMKGGGMLDDQDGDGLCNYVEYLLSEVFDLGVKFDPDDAFSVNANDIDYFYPIGSLYAGEIFTDFDMVEDSWEDSVGTGRANRYLWDALADNDENGWSNFDEKRYAEFAATSASASTAASTNAPVAVKGLPSPALTFTLTYGGTQRLSEAAADETTGAVKTGIADAEDQETAAADAPVIIVAYTDPQLIVPDATYSVMTTNSLLSGKQTVTVSVPVSGHVKGGKNTFVAFCDLDGDGAYTPGEPMGMVSGVAVGWCGAATEIELTDVSPIITRADLTTGESDRHTLYGTDDGDRVPIQNGSLSGGKLQHIKIIRTLVDGWGVEQQLGIVTTNNLVLDKWIELDQRSYFFEGDILSENVFDIDWDHLSTDVLKNANVQDLGLKVTNVCYRIVLGNGSDTASSTNNVFEIVTARHFDGIRAKAIAISPGDAEAVVVSSRPTFRWRMERGANSYTAFKISVMHGGTEVWNSGFVRTPACSKDGVYSYTPDLYVGDILENGEKYTWKVSMYNAKFRTDAYSDARTFCMNVPTDGGLYGEIPVCVKYFGPCASRTRPFCVEAYTTPDFTGHPVARGYTTNVTAVTKWGVPAEANVTLSGLVKGRYYLLAYIDSKTSGRYHVRDDWEGWGYLCAREKDLKAPFKPLYVDLRDGAATAELPVIYIEDVDRNGNKIADMWEMASNGGKLFDGAVQATGTAPGGVVLNKKLTDGLKLKSDAVIGGLTTTIESTLTLPSMASLVLGVRPESVSYRYGSLEVEPTVESVFITSIALDGDEIVLGVNGTRSEPSGFAESIYDIEFKPSTTVTAKIYRTDKLACEWQLVATKPIELSADGTEVRAKVEGLDSGSGFYRVEIEQ